MPKPSETACPECHETGGLEIDWRLIAKPLGTHSLSGTQLKVTARSVPFLMCGSCGLEIEGYVENEHVHFQKPKE